MKDINLKQKKCVVLTHENKFMNLTGIISISGKPGLFKVVAQGKNNIIVESLEDKKKVPAYSTDRISALEDISIYTYEEDKPLKEIFRAIYEKESKGATISHKEDKKKLENYLLEILPNYDQERVYISDIKKIFQWYNLLHSADQLVVETEDSKESEDDDIEKTSKKPVAKKAVKEKSATSVKTTKKPSSPKASSAKKAPAVKTGAARGK